MCLIFSRTGICVTRPKRHQTPEATTTLVNIVTGKAKNTTQHIYMLLIIIKIQYKATNHRKMKHKIKILKACVPQRNSDVKTWCNLESGGALGDAVALGASMSYITIEDIDDVAKQ